MVVGAWSLPCSSPSEGKQDVFLRADKGRACELQCLQKGSLVISCLGMVERRVAVSPLRAGTVELGPIWGISSSYSPALSTHCPHKSPGRLVEMRLRTNRSAGAPELQHPSTALTLPVAQLHVEPGLRLREKSWGVDVEGAEDRLGRCGPASGFLPCRRSWNV